MKTLPTLMFVLAATTPGLSIRADSWLPPREFEVHSSSSNFVARVKPGKDKEAGKLSVFSVKSEERTLVWAAELASASPPCDVELSNTGNHVITFDTWGGYGYGDDVVAIYGPRGLVRKYSLEETFPKPEKVDLPDSADDFMPNFRDFHLKDVYVRDHIDVSTSSRHWRKNSLGFFDMDGLVYCLWADCDWRWLAWDMETGKRLVVGAKQTKRWNQQGRQMILHRMEGRAPHPSEIVFLGRVRDPHDRDLVRKCLGDPSFTTGSITTTRSGEDAPQSSFTYFSESSVRTTADAILHGWDNDNMVKMEGHNHTFSELATLNLIVSFPKGPDHKEGNLIVYLMPSKENASPPYLHAHLDHNYPSRFDGENGPAQLGPEVQFSVRGILPGEYDVFALWDKRGPFAAESPPFSASPGDITVPAPTRINLRAGEVREGVRLQCDHEVK